MRKNICELCSSISDTYKGNAEKVVLINTSDVYDGKCTNHTLVENKQLRGQFKKTFKPNDILYSEIRPANRRFAYIDFDTNNYIASTKLMVLRAKEGVNPKYLYQILRGNSTINALQLLAESRSGTFPQITFSELSNIEVNIPSEDVQNMVVSILSSLDAKIETNNKLNEKLEEMAQAIFKSWFVDFEPFKDQPFHETEIGYIPQIFESGVLGDLCTFKRGKGLLSKDAIPGDVPVIAGGMKPACYHNVANTKAPVVTVSGSGANAGYTQIHNVDVWASDCSFIDSNCENLYYAYCFLSRRPKLLKHSQTGAAQPHVKPADIHRFQVVIPSKEIINEFQQIVKPLFDRIGMNKIENDRLASLRDTLLPRLMSGEIKI